MRIFNFLKSNIGAILMLVVAILFLVSYKHFVSSKWLEFSDSAKFADIARNLSQGKGLGKSFNFFDSKLTSLGKDELFSTRGVPIANPLAMYLTFKFFGISDLTVTYVSMTSYILSVIFIYLLGKKLFSKPVGLMAGLLFSGNVSTLNYAVSGASESLFILEVIISFYLVSLNKRWSLILLLPILILMYFTRPQAFIFMAGLFVFWLILNFGIKKSLTTILIVGAVCLSFDRFVLYPLSFKTPIYSITSRGEQAILYYSAGESTSDGLRGGGTTKLTYTEIAKKVFYNIYNFYKLLPQIASPYLWGLFTIGLFIWTKDRFYNSFKVTTIFVLITTLIVAAITIPLIRYIHPVIPLIYLVAADTLFFIIKKITDKQNLIIISSLFLVIFFGLGQSIGTIFLDSRFERNTHNIGKSPIYVNFAKILQENTSTDQEILTNLDTWGSWYGERKTVWYPIEPKFVTALNPSEIPFDAIYLTDYLIDDQNYYMSESWRQVFNNPNNPEKWLCEGCVQISNQYKLKGIYQISAIDNYDNRNGRAILLIKK